MKRGDFHYNVIVCYSMRVAAASCLAAMIDIAAYQRFGFGSWQNAFCAVALGFFWQTANFTEHYIVGTDEETEEREQ